MSNDRVPCQVFGCRRTARRELFDHPDVEILCGKHWRVIPKRMRRLMSLINRRYRAGKLPRWRVERFWRKCVNKAQADAWMAS